MASSVNNAQQLSDETIKKIQQCCQEILDVFVQICEENNLRYYLIAGTLLGAVRHQGPIPWDDDVDVCMPREDFEKFKQIMLARPENETVHIHCFENDPNMPILAAKLRKRGTVYKKQWYVNIGAKFNEIYLDIFPLDDSPGISCLRFRLLKRILIMNGRIVSVKVIKKCRMRTKFFRAMLSPIPLQAIVRFGNRLKQIGNHKGYKYYVNWVGSVDELAKFTMPKEWFGTGTKVLYSGKYYTAPCEWDKVLTHTYGDYMKLPPVEERKGHAVLEVKV